jgi:hypothetical protein
MFYFILESDKADARGCSSPKEGATSMIEVYLKIFDLLDRVTQPKDTCYTTMCSFLVQDGSMLKAGIWRRSHSISIIIMAPIILVGVHGARIANRDCCFHAPVLWTPNKIRLYQT